MRPLAIAFLAENPALSALLGKGLEDAGSRVAVFSEPDAFVTYLRIAPVDLVVIDADSQHFATADFAWSLRTHPKLASHHFLTVALTRADAPSRSELRAAGIDLVLSKPIGATQLLLAAEDIDRGIAAARREAGLGTGVPSARRRIVAQGPVQRPAQYTDNVVPLFADGRRPR